MSLLELMLLANRRRMDLEEESGEQSLYLTQSV